MYARAFGVALAVVASTALARGGSSGDAVVKVAWEDRNCVTGGCRVQQAIGSGVVVGRADRRVAILTAAHNLRGYEPGIDGPLLVRVQGTGRTYRASVVASEPHRDIAVLAVITDEAMPMLPLAEGSAVVGQPAWVMGYPGGMYRYRYTSVQGWFGGNVMVYSGLPQGVSGGPIVSQDAKVLGLQCFIDGRNQGGGPTAAQCREMLVRAFGAIPTSFTRPRNEPVPQMPPPSIQEPREPLPPPQVIVQPVQTIPYYTTDPEGPGTVIRSAPKLPMIPNSGSSPRVDVIVETLPMVPPAVPPQVVQPAQIPSYDQSDLQNRVGDIEVRLNTLENRPIVMEIRDPVTKAVASTTFPPGAPIRLEYKSVPMAK